MLADRHEVRRELDKNWGVPVDEASEAEVDPESWGATADAQSGNIAAMAIADGLQ